MAEFLPENYEFNYRGDVQYAWFSFTLPGGFLWWGSRSIGYLVINYSARPELADAMRAHLGTDTVWSPTMFYFIYWG